MNGSELGLLIIRVSLETTSIRIGSVRRHQNLAGTGSLRAPFAAVELANLSKTLQISTAALTIITGRPIPIKALPSAGSVTILSASTATIIRSRNAPMTGVSGHVTICKSSDWPSVKQSQLPSLSNRRWLPDWLTDII